MPDEPETQALLLSARDAAPGDDDDDDDEVLRRALSNRILPVAFAAATGTAAAAAPTVFAFATLFCADPLHCSDDERRAFARAMSASAMVASVCGILAVGPVESIFRHGRRKMGIVAWLCARGAGVVMFVTAVYLHARIDAVPIALLGRVFEGFATDDLLHLNLNALYVESSPPSDAPRLLGSSLALYMTGMALGPVVAGFLRTAMAAFFVAIACFALSLLYLTVFVRGGTGRDPRHGEEAVVLTSPDVVDGDTGHSTPRGPLRLAISGTLRPLLRPIAFFASNISALPSGLALLFLNAGQGYFFQALLVHTSTILRFSPRQNGWIISCAAGSSGLYLFVVLYVIPRISALMTKHAMTSIASSRPGALISDYILALISLLIFTTTTTLLAWASEPWQIYCLVSLTGVGLAAPPFVKSHLNALVADHDRSRAVAALTVMESLGSVMSPIIMGTLQSSASLSKDYIFFAASALIFSSALLFSVQRRLPFKDHD